MRPTFVNKDCVAPAERTITAFNIAVAYRLFMHRLHMSFRITLAVIPCEANAAFGASNSYLPSADKS